MENEFKNDTNYLDQHFLIDESILEAFVDNCDLNKTDTVVEVGPGKCEISKYLAKKVSKLTCIELDKRLKPYLDDLQNNNKNVEVIYGSALDTFIPKCNKIVSALPYSIVEPFVEKLLRCDFEEAILIVGKRFADNVTEKSINKLALLTNSFFRVEKVMDIAPDAFEPRPRVMSSMIKMYPIKREELQTSFKKFIFRELFFNRERKLKNSLMEALISFVGLHGKQLTKNESRSIIEKYNLPETMLNKVLENLSNEDYKLLYDALEQ